ncbi:hypothetical protein ACFLW4_02465 [Chloroflexota bacterium]
MKREDPREEAERLLRESTRRLEQVRDDYEIFSGNLKLADTELEAVYDAYMSGDCEEAWSIVERDLRNAHASIKEALEFSPAFTNQREETNLRAMLDEIVNLQIDAYNWITRVRKEQKVIQRPTGKPVCPAMLYYRGVDNLLEATPDDFKWCELECPYQDKCDSDPKQRYMPASTR